MVTRFRTTACQRRKISSNRPSSVGPLPAASAELRIPLDGAALARFEQYLQEVLYWRRRINLIPAGDPVQVVNRHFIDSLLVLSAGDFPERCRIVDVGSGAGFPGIAMKLARPDLKITLVEASRRRVAFLEHIVATLTLEDIEIAWTRAEDFGRRADRREAYDRSVERAAARIGAAVELCLPLVRVGGSSLFLKGPRVVGELDQARPLITGLGGQIVRNEVRTLPTTGTERAVVIVAKVTPTPLPYPRRAGRGGEPSGT